MSCIRCRDTGQIVDFDGHVSECPEEECLKQRAVDALGVVPRGSSAVFKGGTWKLSVAIKGFELADDSIEKLSDASADEILASVGLKVESKTSAIPPGIAIDVEEIE